MLFFIASSRTFADSGKLEFHFSIFTAPLPPPSTHLKVLQSVDERTNIHSWHRSLARVYETDESLVKAGRGNLEQK